MGTQMIKGPQNSRGSQEDPKGQVTPGVWIRVELTDHQEKPDPRQSKNNQDPDTTREKHLNPTRSGSATLVDTLYIRSCSEIIYAF